MKPRFSVLMLCLLAATVFSLASQSNAQRAPRGQVHALQATSDKGGEHPAKTEISSPATVTSSTLRRRRPTGLSRPAMLRGPASPEF
jgi:hypothetical protein